MVRVILIGLLIVVAAVVLAVLLLRREPPPLPLDLNHQTSQSERECLSCHGPGEKNPRKPTHPNASDCYRCHVQKQAA